MLTAANIVKRKNEHLIKSEITGNTPLKILLTDCKESRKPETGGCPNGLKCGAKVGGKTALERLADFRLDLCNGNRGKNLTRKLRETFHLENGAPKLSFIFGGVLVCKSFYRECTGFRKNHFNAAVLRALEMEESTPVVMPTTPLNQNDLKTLGCLDHCFSRRSIKRDPSKVCNIVDNVQI